MTVNDTVKGSSCFGAPTGGGLWQSHLEVGPGEHGAVMCSCELDGHCRHRPGDTDGWSENETAARTCLSTSTTCFSVGQLTDLFFNESFCRAPLPSSAGEQEMSSTVLAS